jgi:hypothetical protein
MLANGGTGFRFPAPKPPEVSGPDSYSSRLVGAASYKRDFAASSVGYHADGNVRSDLNELGLGPKNRH